MPSNTGDPRDVRIAMLEQDLKVAELARERAEYRLADLLRRLYGPKSDKISSDQLALLRGVMEADQAIADERQPLPETQDAETGTTAKRKGGGRRPAPTHLPIDIVPVDPPADELQGMKRIRDEITEEIDYRPSQFIRRHFVRGVWVREDSEGAPIMAPLPPRVIPQSGLGAGLITHTLVAKYS